MQLPSPNFATISVGTPIQMVSVWPKVNSAMHVEAITTTLHYASKGDTGKTTSSKEALSQANAATAMDVAPAAPQVGTGSTVIARVAIPGSLLTVPHIVPPVVHSAHLNRHSTPHRYYQDALEVIPADSITTGS